MAVKNYTEVLEFSLASDLLLINGEVKGIEFFSSVLSMAIFRPFSVIYLFTNLSWFMFACSFPSSGNYYQVVGVCTTCIFLRTDRLNTLSYAMFHNTGPKTEPWGSPQVRTLLLPSPKLM